MTCGSGVRKHAREALVTGAEFIELIARNGVEAASWAEDSLMRAGTGKDEDMERATFVQGRHLVRHRPGVENVALIPAAGYAAVAGLKLNLWRPARSGLWTGRKRGLTPWGRGRRMI